MEETRVLMPLEGELNATLLFEHGGHQPTSLLWIARIRLDRLFRERVALGRTVKVFAKHYRKEVMRGLVKIQDLVDLAEPPLGGLSAAKTWNRMWTKRNHNRIRRTLRIAPTRLISVWVNASPGLNLCLFV